MNNSLTMNLLQPSMVNIVLYRKYESFQESPIQNFLSACQELLIPYLRNWALYAVQGYNRTCYSLAILW